MKKKKISPKEASRKYVRMIAYFLFFYFGIRLILIPVFIAETFGLVNLVLNLAIVLFGIFAAFKLLKMKKWALIAVIVIFVIQILNGLIWSAYMGSFRLPIVQIAILIALIGGFKQLKNAQ